MPRFRYTFALILLANAPVSAEPTVVGFQAARGPALFDHAPPLSPARRDHGGWRSADWECDLLSDLADGRLDQRSLLEAALIVGGVRDQHGLGTCQQRWRQILAGLELMPAAANTEKTRQLFQFMHDQVLTGNYCEACNALDRTLVEGDYNCVTATIVCCCLARHFGIPMQPVSLPGHVLCRVPGQNPFNVETTDSNWQPSVDDFVGGIGRPLTDVELLAKLFYNRGLAKLAQRDFAAALAATELSWQLDHQHESARDNVATVINNWALDLTTKAQFEQALALLERGQQLVPEHPILYANQAHIRDAWSRQTSAQAP